MTKTETPKELYVSRANERAVLFEDGEFPIYQLKDGRFAFEHVDWIIRDSVKAIRKAIERLKDRIATPLKIMSDDDTPEVLDAVAMVTRWITTADGRKERLGYGHWYLYDEKIAEALTKLNAAKRNADEVYETKHDALTAKLVRVRPDTFTSQQNAATEAAKGKS